MKVLNRLADRLLTRMVPNSEAKAACVYSVLECQGGKTYRCYYDRCNGQSLGCTKIENFC